MDAVSRQNDIYEKRRACRPSLFPLAYKRYCRPDAELVEFMIEEMGTFNRLIIPIHTKEMTRMTAADFYRDTNTKCIMFSLSCERCHGSNIITLRIILHKADLNK